MNHLPSQIKRYIPLSSVWCIGLYWCDHNWHIRLWRLVGNEFSVRTFLIRLAAVSYRGTKIRTVASAAVRSVNKSRETRITSKTSQGMRYVSSSPLFHSTKPQDKFCVIWFGKYATITIVLTMATVTLQVTAVSDGHGRCHGDNPWKFRNDLIVWGIRIA